MSRGMPSFKALAAAVMVAQLRGQVISLRQYPGTTCDFLISGAGGLAAVGVRRSLRITASLAEIARQYHDTLARICSAEHAPGIAREFWLWSNHGSMRFFLIEGAVLIEINRHGVPLNPPVSAPIAMSPKTDVALSVKKSGGSQSGKRSGETDSGKNIFPEKGPGPSPPAEPPGISGPVSPPGPADKREPAPVRFLRHRAKERRVAMKPPAGPGPDIPRGGTPPG